MKKTEAYSIKHLVHYLKVICAIFGITSAAQTAQIPTITVSVPLIQSVNERSGTGRNIAHLENIFALCGWSFNPRYMIMGEHIDGFSKDSAIDAIAMVPDGEIADGFPTSLYISFTPGVIFQRSENQPITSLDDLSGKRVMAFRGAASFMPALAAHIPDFRHYSESFTQIAQARALAIGRVDVVVSDGLIFTGNLEQLKAQNDPLIKDTSLNDLQFSPVFGRVWDRMFFRDEAKAAAFDACLRKSVQNGSYITVEKTAAAPYQGFLDSFVITQQEIETRLGLR